MPIVEDKNPDYPNICGRCGNVRRHELHVGHNRNVGTGYHPGPHRFIASMTKEDYAAHLVTQKRKAR